MPKTREEANLFIYKSGVFDFRLVHDTIRKWFTDNEFVAHETVYKQKKKDQGFEYTNEWEANRNITQYTRYKIMIEMKIWDAPEVEVVIKGKKEKRLKSRVRINVKSELITDWEDRWSRNPWLEKFRIFYENYLIKRRIEDVWETEIWKLSYDLHTKLKQALELEAEKNG
ncbi:hypothetical protein KY311_03675 [Candidatus Woesearchaeota archaeon]|nr:hypothetical protein [Candidatus Woesearchaeota archaeon]